MLGRGSFQGVTSVAAAVLTVAACNRAPAPPLPDAPPPASTTAELMGPSPPSIAAPAPAPPAAAAEPVPQPPSPTVGPAVVAMQPIPNPPEAPAVRSPPRPARPGRPADPPPVAPPRLTAIPDPDDWPYAPRAAQPAATPVQEPQNRQVAAPNPQQPAPDSAEAKAPPATAWLEPAIGRSIGYVALAAIAGFVSWLLARRRLARKLRRRAWADLSLR